MRPASGRGHASACLALLLACLLALLAASCASVGSPQGGPIDNTGPDTIGAWPPNRSTQRTPREVLFEFNEYLKAGIGPQDVFITPLLPPGAVRLRHLNRRLWVQFRQPLDDSTTYIISLGTGIKDHTAGNPLKTPIQYAFATGSRLDTCSLSGNLLDAASLQPAKNMWVLLHDSLTTPPDSLGQQPPRYAASTTAQGSFTLGYLKPGTYWLLATNDADRNYRYNLPTEQLGLATAPTLYLSEQAGCQRSADLRLSTPDDQPPRINSLRWRHRNLAELDLTEPALATWNPADSTGPDTLFTPPNEASKVWLLLPPHLPDSLMLTLTLTDSLGNRTDSLLRLRRPARRSETALVPQWLPMPKRWQGQAWNPQLQQLYIADLWPPDWARHVRLIDSAGTVLEAKPTRMGNRLLVPVLVGKTPVRRLAIDSGFASPAGLRPDSSLVLEVPAWVPTAWGRVSGSFPSTHNDTAVVLELHNPETQHRVYIAESPFVLPHLPVGTWNARLLLDADRNGRFSPARWQPRRLPERWVPAAETLKLLPGWEVEDYRVTWPTQPPPQSLSRPGP